MPWTKKVINGPISTREAPLPQSRDPISIPPQERGRPARPLFSSSHREEVSARRASDGQTEECGRHRHPTSTIPRERGRPARPFFSSSHREEVAARRTSDGQTEEYVRHAHQTSTIPPRSARVPPAPFSPPRNARRCRPGAQATGRRRSSSVTGTKPRPAPQERGRPARPPPFSSSQREEVAARRASDGQTEECVRDELAPTTAAPTSTPLPHAPTQPQTRSRAAPPQDQTSGEGLAQARSLSPQADVPHSRRSSRS